MKIAIWYHCRLAGGSSPPINPDVSMPIMAEQMKLAQDSGLVDAASEIHIVSNGGHGPALYAAMLAPPKAIVHDNGAKAESLLPTVNRIREWLPSHKGWLVCFSHTKGVTHPHDDLTIAWRRCMDTVAFGAWRQCVHDLQAGFESVGAHWLTRERFGTMVSTPFWGGMVFWATADFLLTLPAVPQVPTCRADWFISEGWIGSGPRPPKVKDYRPHWPSLAACHS